MVRLVKRGSWWTGTFKLFEYMADQRPPNKIIYGDQLSNWMRREALRRTNSAFAVKDADPALGVLEDLGKEHH